MQGTVRPDNFLGIHSPDAAGHINKRMILPSIDHCSNRNTQR